MPKYFFDIPNIIKYISFLELSSLFSYWRQIHNYNSKVKRRLTAPDITLQRNNNSRFHTAKEATHKQKKVLRVREYLK